MILRKVLHNELMQSISIFCLATFFRNVNRYVASKPFAQALQDFLSAHFEQVFGQRYAK